MNLNLDNCHKSIDAGANVIVSGTGLFEIEEPEAFVKLLKESK